MGLCPSNLVGTTGWVASDEEHISSHLDTSYREVFCNLANENGIPLYKLVDGFAERRTAEEIAEDEAALPPVEETDEVDDAVALDEIMGVLNND